VIDYATEEVLHVPVAPLLVILLAGVWLLVTGDLALGQVVIGLIAGAVFVEATGAARGARVSVAGLPRRIGWGWLGSGAQPDSASSWKVAGTRFAPSPNSSR
jgi:hypothetical protein